MNLDLIWALLLSWGAGLNLYLTVFLAGACGRVGWVQLPADLAFLSDGWSLGISGLLFLVEFFADKIPYVDSVWDAVHTFIRVPAGILLALGSVEPLPKQWLFLIGLAAGLVSFGTHGAKSTLRLAANSSPEPFSNVFLSLVEDGLIAVAYWLFFNHPVVLVIFLLVAVVLAWLTIYLLVRIFKRLFQFPRRNYEGLSTED